MKMNDIDPRRLIKDSYRIDGISPHECRSVFLDWALGSLQDIDLKIQIQFLLDHFESENPNHPMTLVLKDGLSPAAAPIRRGGRKARLGRNTKSE